MPQVRVLSPRPFRGKGKFAGVAQLVEQLICNQQVGGSSPSTSSIVGASAGSLASVRAQKLVPSVAPPLQIKPAALGFDLVDFEARYPLRSPTGFGGAQVHTEEFPSGQRGQTVNLLQFASVVRIHPPPPSPETS